uniref:Iron-sulfur cluster assembly 1 homolog, mitochondrial n=1 Tax=Athene cunicularia TaxID=194338 RepID=A0A663MXB6_ATHCN
MKDCPMRRKLRRRRDYEDNKIQRYIESKEKRSKEEKETQNKTTEKENLVKEGKLHPCTPQKRKLARAVVETGKEKPTRQSAEKWKRLEERDLREKRCFICGREGHIKKECPQYKGAAGGSKPEVSYGSPSLPSTAKRVGRLNQTPSAVQKIKQLLKDKPEHVGVKVGVRTRGCNGLSYTLEYTKSKGDSDEEVVQDGVRVFIEKKAQLTLLGTEMDYVEDKLSSEFIFNNPNIKGTCGCGESFNI